jgi:O-antigen/teichoic acid export membrane protein
MSESPLKRLLVQASHYSLASLFTMIAGLVSFPLLTRVFSVEDYGLMSLVAATVSISVALGKVGVQHSIVRYFSEISAGKSRYTVGQLTSTTVFGMLGTALVVASSVALFAQVAPLAWLGPERLRILVTIGAALVVVQVVESALVNLLRAEQRTKALMGYQVAKKYLTLGGIAFAVLVVARSLFAFYAATVLAEGLMLLVLGRALFGGDERPRPRIADVSRPLYRELLAFGLPMMIGYELSGIVLSVGDRYVIEGILGPEPLGLYGAAYNLCQYVQGVAIVSVGQAIMPMYMQMWDRNGPEETSAFIARALRNYVIVAAPIVAGLAAIGADLLPALASEKYSSASGVLPWVVAGMVIDGTTSMLGAGLFIQRKTRTIMTIILGCASLNIALNFVLVPKLGITGSAMATLVSYVAAAFAMAIASRRLLPVAIPWATIVRAGIVSTLMFFVITRLHPGGRVANIAVRVAVAIPLYAVAMMLVDGDARAFIRTRGGRR